VVVKVLMNVRPTEFVHDLAFFFKDLADEALEFLGRGLEDLLGAGGILG
jgi:hypothetical protein